MEQPEQEASGAPLVGFLFGNVDEKNRVEADYLDEDAKEHLGGFARLQGGALELQAELQADGDQPAGGGAGDTAVRPAPDARDFADEAELIEDAEQAAAAAAEQQRQLGVVAVALQAGGAAEEEDYDFDEEEGTGGERPAAAAAPAPAALGAPLVQPLVAPAALPAATATPARPGTAPIPAPAAPVPPAEAPPQLVAAHQRHVRLPVLGQSLDGETVLRFSELYGYQGVMAGHVATVDELRPPPLLPRGQHRAAAGQQAHAAAAQPEVEQEDEEALMLAADLEIPPEEEEEEESDAEQAPQQPPRGMHEAAALPAAAAQAQQGGQPQLQRARSTRPAREQPPQQAAPSTLDEAADGDAEAADVHAVGAAVSGDAGLLDGVFAPVNTLAWEEKVMWQGAAVDAGAESEHETDDEQGPTAAGAWGQSSQQAQPNEGSYQEPPPEDGAAAAMPDATQQPMEGQHEQWGQQQLDQPQQEAQPALHADIAAMFEQQTAQPPQLAQQNQALAATHFENGLPMVFMPTGPDAAPLLQQQQQPASEWGQRQAGVAAWSQPGGQVTGTGPSFAEPPAELPGLTSTSAEEMAARAAAESDEEEYLTLPTAPLLRLELLSLAGGIDGERQRPKPLDPAPDMLPVHRESWEDRIAWEGAKNAESIRIRGAVFDLNDSQQTFELTQPIAQQPASATGQADGDRLDVAGLVSQAAALIIQPQAVALPLPPRGSGFDPNNPEEVELWRLQQGLAREREYHQLAKRKAGTAATVRVLHAKLAADLATIPILNPTPHTQDEVLALALWHTPRGKWWPLEVGRVAWNVGGKKGGKGGASGPVTVTISSLPGLSKVFQAVGLDTQLVDLWKHLVENIALFKAASTKQPLILAPGRPPLPLALNQPLLATGAVKEGQKQVKLTIAFRDIELLASGMVAAVPSNDNPALLRPPNAFTRKRDFSAAEPGHVVLLEYMEQQPPLLNRPGMGAKLVTYYRKQDAADTGHQKLKLESPRWRVGAVQPLGDDDDSPFLGQLAKGSSSLSVESGLFRSLAFPYNPSHTDFLLVRTPAGAMQLRELNGTVMVGQQLPMLRVPAPTAREVKDLEERRIYVYVFKHLRRQQAKLDKDPTKLGQRASITLKALAETFPSRPPAMIRAYLKDSCDLAVRPHGETEIFSLKEGARPPSEAELRKKLTPEETCALEACYVAAFRMKQRGLVMHEKLDKAAIEKLRLAAEMLPPEENFQKAARLVEQAMQSAPWTLTDAFVTHFREGKAQLQLAGAADPTGRGFGYSFVRDVRHKHANADDVTKQMAKRQAGKVQGTDADLRRMTTAQARERLRGYGLTEEEIQGLGRWTMIDMVRQLASAAAQDGTVDAAAVKFVRHQKTTLIELQRRAAEKAQQILEKQLAVLNNSAGEDLGDQDALEAELERELAAAEAAEAEGAPTPQGKKGKREGTPTPDDEQQMMQQMRAEGLMATPAAGTSAAPATAGAASAAPLGSGGPPPKDGPGTKRIRREVFLKAADGSWQKSHEIIYIGRDRPGQLHSLYQKEGTGNYPYGFGTRTIAGRPKELRLSYAAARGRGIGRSGPRAAPAGGRGRGAGGRGRGNKAAAAADEASPEVARARQSSRQRKQRQFGDEVLDGEELLSDDGDFEYNEEAEAPYFAVPEQPQPKQPRKKKKKEAAPVVPSGTAEEGQPAAQGEQPVGAALEEPAASALPDDFAAALAAATMVRAPSVPALVDQQPQASAGAPSQAPAASAGGASAGASQPGQQRAQQEPSAQQQEQQQQPQQPQDVQQPALQPAQAPAAAKPKFKIKLGGGAAPSKPQPAKLQREPSPDFVYDFTAGDEEEEDEQQRRRAGKAKDADYEAPAEEGSEDEFVPDDEEISEEEGEERRFLKKARSRSRNFDAPLARSGSRRSAGSTGGARSRGGGGGAKKKGGGGGGGSRKGGSSAGGGARRGKRSRADYEDEEFDEEEDVELSDEDVETVDDDEDDAATSDEAATPQTGSRQRPTAGASGAMAAAGQLGTVGRQLGTILSSIVQQLRNIKKQFGYPAKLTRVYELVFGKVPSAKHAPDYHQWVPKASVIVLPECQKKAKAGRYLSLEQFRADLQQLYQNAVAYNTPGHGNFGDPYFIQLAGELLTDSETLIAQHLNEIEAAEAGQRYGYQQGGYGGQPPQY